ncbi:hypothetical protein U9M48_001412 [Paspalum notatum var. saurae]|uniref:Uncharacterized protein n=1 Tax=Paspalum notatum var. saurae TaxID=547442 RepID=A0AAQ3PEU7_PASNO
MNSGLYNVRQELNLDHGEKIGEKRRRSLTEITAETRKIQHSPLNSLFALAPGGF